MSNFDVELRALIAMWRDRGSDKESIIEALLYEAARLGEAKGAALTTGTRAVSEQKHTPDNWIQAADGNETIREDSDALIRRLIAERADMLAALKAVVAVADRKTVEFDRARAVIAKAKGKP